jgi:2-epi-5-epi-valiolone dehydrogenase / demethylgadusol O-methyltransferase
VTGERDVVAGAGGRSILERMRLDGRRALVTGAGQGIGRAFAHALGEAGARVAVVDLDAARADAVAAELTSKGVEAVGLDADVAADGAAEACVGAVVERFGGLEIAVNNAGVNRNSAAEDTPPEEWDEVFRLNARAVFLGCQAQARTMLAAGYGKIVNTASMASLIVPHPQKQAAYNASKAAVVTLTRTLAAEWADRGVRVNCISPGIIRTALIDGNPELAPLVEEWVTQIPAGRLGEVTDLQAAIVYLACEASDYMTGHNLAIEGGQTLW